MAPLCGALLVKLRIGFAILASAQKKADEDDYESAYKIVKDGLKEYPDSEQLKDKGEEYRVERDEIEDIIDRAQGNASSGSYDRALDVIDAGLKTYPKSQKLKDARASIAKSKEEHESARMAEEQNTEPEEPADTNTAPDEGMREEPSAPVEETKADVDKSGAVVILGMNDGRPTQYATELTDMGFSATAYEAAIYPFTENLVIYSDAAYEEEATAIAAYLGSDYTAILNDGSYAMPVGSNVYVRVKAE